eukprot:gene38123-47049_t
MSCEASVAMALQAIVTGFAVYEQIYDWNFDPSDASKPQYRLEYKPKAQSALKNRASTQQRPTNTDIFSTLHGGTADRRTEGTAPPFDITNRPSMVGNRMSTLSAEFEVLVEGAEDEDLWNLIAEEQT